MNWNEHNYDQKQRTEKQNTAVFLATFYLTKHVPDLQHDYARNLGHGHVTPGSGELNLKGTGLLIN